MTHKKPTSKNNTPKKTIRKKSPAKKTAGTRKNKPKGKISVKSQLAKSVAGICLLIVLVVAAGFFFQRILLKSGQEGAIVTGKIEISEPPNPPKSSPAEIPVIAPKEKTTSSPPTPEKEKQETPNADRLAAVSPPEKPKYEIFPEKDFIPRKEPTKPPPDVAPSELPRVAIIIDDLGYDPRLAQKFLDIDTRLTFAVIPSSPFHRKVARMIGEKGGELMLHLPMEPEEYPAVDPGPGALLTNMSPDELLGRLEGNLSRIPGIKGVNGHMGSRLTASSEQMNQIFTILKRENLYFVDSFTTPRSVCESSAKLLQVPFARRDVFIDHLQDEKFIRAQMDRLVKIAQKHGEAVGIAHPHKATIKVLQEVVPEIKKKVELTPASKLVKIVG